MSFVGSLCFGTAGSYNFLGLPVIFQGDEKPLAPHKIERIFNACMQVYSHALCHEFAHMFAYKILTGNDCRITIFTYPMRHGKTAEVIYAKEMPLNHHRAIVTAIGPLASALFCYAKIVTSRHLVDRISPMAAKYFRYVAMAHLSMEVLGEVGNLLTGKHDLGKLAKLNRCFAAMTMTALVGIFALAIHSMRGISK